MANPKVINAVNAPFPTTVEVYFDSGMNSSELTDPENYLLNHGAYTTAAHAISDSSVMLVVENLFGYDDFTITVQNITNTSGETIDTGFNSWTFGIIRPNMPIYALAVSSTNGILKSGTNAIQIKQDSNYWYIMTESGIDIVGRVSLDNVGYILDTDGFNAIHVSV